MPVVPGREQEGISVCQSGSVNLGVTWVCTVYEKSTELLYTMHSSVCVL